VPGDVHEYGEPLNECEIEVLKQAGLPCPVH